MDRNCNGLWLWSRATRGQANITILDRARLEAAVCECYRVVKTEVDRLLRPAAAP
jgi:hypothetical protein